MLVKRNLYSTMVWERDRGITFPATTDTDLQLFTGEVREIVLEKMRYVRFVSLVFDPNFKRNYIPMEAFLNGRDGNILLFDEQAEKLYHFFFANSTTVIYPDGYIEFNFHM